MKLLKQKDLANMNKKDIFLILSLLVISLIGIFFLKSGKKGNYANVYYENKLLLTIDLNDKEKKDYVVTGALGDIVIQREDGKVRVVEENSPRHLCSKQGFISSSYETIVCLPNKIVIRIEDNQLDGVVR